jgi:hypothetical protein
MKAQTYLLDLELASKREGASVARPATNRVTSNPEDDLLTRASRTIGEVAFGLLTIGIVGAHPLWVMWLLVFVYSR